MATISFFENLYSTITKISLKFKYMAQLRIYIKKKKNLTKSQMYGAIPLRSGLTLHLCSMIAECGCGCGHGRHDTDIFFKINFK